MGLTRIKSQSILDREVREQDLADGAVSFDKLLLSDTGNPGDVLTVDGFGNLLFSPATGTPRLLNSLDDVSVGGALNNQVLAFNAPAGLWRAITIPGLAASNNTYLVNDITARNALTPNEGDSIFVRSGFSAEWELYLYDSGFGGGPWVLMATADSASTDANTIEYPLLTFDSTDGTNPVSTPITLGNISNGSRVTVVSVEIITPFTPTGPAAAITFDIGDDAVNWRLMDADLIDFETVGTYVSSIDYVYDGTEVGDATSDTDIKAYFVFTGTTTGELRITVTHV